MIMSLLFTNGCCFVYFYQIGQELQKCLLDLRTPPFAHGHLYVALSRVRRYTDIAIFTNEENVRNGIVITENIVYPELYKNLIN